MFEQKAETFNFMKIVYLCGWNYLMVVLVKVRSFLP